MPSKLLVNLYAENPKHYNVYWQSECGFAENADVSGKDTDELKANSERRDKIVSLLKEAAAK